MTGAPAVAARPAITMASRNATTPCHIVGHGRRGRQDARSPGGPQRLARSLLVCRTMAQPTAAVRTRPADARPLPAVLDLEASGFGPSSYPIEVGFVLPSGQAHCTLIRPLPEWTHWDPQAAQVHGIPRRLLENRGRDAIQVAHWLNRHLRGLTVYSDAWGHDYTWIHRLFAAAVQLPSFKLEPIQSLFGADDLSAWDGAQQSVREQLGSPRHRASADARVMQRALALLPSRAPHPAAPTVVR